MEKGLISQKRSAQSTFIGQGTDVIKNKKPPKRMDPKPSQQETSPREPKS